MRHLSSALFIGVCLIVGSACRPQSVPIEFSRCETIGDPQGVLRQLFSQTIRGQRPIGVEVTDEYVQWDRQNVLATSRGYIVSGAVTTSRRTIYYNAITDMQIFKNKKNPELRITANGMVYSVTVYDWGLAREGVSAFMCLIRARPSKTP